MAGFTPIAGAVGGALIGLGLALALVTSGRIAGLSGVIAGVVRGADRAWRAWFLIGALAVGAVWRLVSAEAFDARVPASLPLVAIAGVLAGVGTRASNGCTSGHGLCGMARLSRRSMVATCVFMASGIATATIMGWLCRR